jgi:tetratricopeptide (TPR) repeat protein
MGPAAYADDSARTDLPHGFAGDFLASHHAQAAYDWEAAYYYLSRILEHDSQNQELLKRSMVLAAGSGDLAAAAEQAGRYVDAGGEKTLALIIMVTHALSRDDFVKAEEYLDELPGSDMTDFIKPILMGWALAGKTGNMKEYLRGEFTETSVHVFHGALMALYVDDNETARSYIQRMMKFEGLSAYEGERIADLLVLSGSFEEAQGLYKGLYIQAGGGNTLEAKLDAFENDQNRLMKALRSLDIKTPAEGVAWAMHDMGRILYQEYSDTSAKLFASLALALNPELVEARLLLANTLARNGRYEEAIDQYVNISKDNAYYLQAQYLAVELMVELGNDGEAKDTLEAIFKQYGDVSALIQLGELYRHAEDYDQALKAYDRAAKYLKNEISEDNWYLLYARGMTYEQKGMWGKAEEDLQAALGYRPDDPYILNYLGYSWADQGTNLEKSLELIQKAVALVPMDGYITDSLGWVHYMMGNYEEALPYLERSAELLPYDSVINDHLGDVYWRVGRHLEAKFQWERALNNAEDDDDVDLIKEKLRNGLSKSTSGIREAKN